MKKIVNFCLAFCLLFSCFAFVGCNRGGLQNINLTIENFENYQSISVGVPKANMANVPAGVARLAEAKGKKAKPQLIGQRPDGSFETISFEEEEDGETLISNYGIRAVKEVGRFLVVEYKQNHSGEVLDYINGWTDDSIFILLDKETGKMFDVTKYRLNVFTQGMYCASADSLFSNCNSGAICKFTVVDGQLEVKELIDESKVTVFNNTFISDRYGNLYSVKGYMFSTAGKLSTFGEFEIAQNGIVYCGDQWVNAEGELEEATFIPTDMTTVSYLTEQRSLSFCYRGNESLVYQEGNTYYYRDSTNSSYNMGYDKIYKYTFKNDIEYTLEVISMQKYKANKGVIIGERIYFLDETEIYYINIKDGQYTSLVSEYFFNKLWTDNQGGVLFEGVDEYLNDVTGEIAPDGTTTIGITPKNYEIYYISPIN